MKRAVPVLSIVLAATATVVAPARGQGFVASKGQSKEQQSKDVADCQAIATQQTGMNPAAPQAATPPPQRGQRARGAARGAAVGAAAGAIGGDAGKGAAAGAAAGTVAGGVRARQARREHQAQQAATAQSQTAYNNAIAACMQGKGYTPK